MTVLGIAVGYMAWRNGRVIKENTERLLQSQERILQAQDKILQGQERILQTQERILQTQEKILNEIKEMNKSQRIGFRMLCLMILAKNEDERKMYAQKLLEEL